MSIRNIPPIELLTYLLSDLLHYRTYASCLFLYYLRVGLGYEFFWTERCGNDRLGGGRKSLIAAVKLRASRSYVLYSGFGVGQKWSIEDLCRSKNTLSNKVL